MVFRMDTDSRQAGIRKALAEEIRAARARKKYSQGELADLAGLSRATVARLEMGTRSADVVQLIAIADALGIDPGVMLDAAQRKNRAEQG